MPERRKELEDGYCDLRNEEDFQGFVVVPKLVKRRTIIKLDHEKDWDFQRRINQRMVDLKEMIAHSYDNPVFRGKVKCNRSRTVAEVIVTLLKGDLKEELK